MVMPFNYVKQLMLSKGYIINSYSNKTHPNKIVNESIYKYGIFQSAIETFELEILII